ncbi:TPA: hypothetical protein DEB00_00465 [Candidatus Uhrbacteria bacterium]|nr:hypothetical protein [Candidatus Uhrbacteria bacterium]
MLHSAELRKLEQNLSGEVVCVNKIPHGVDNAVYLIELSTGEGYILKHYPTRNIHNMHRAIANAKGLRAKGINTPRVSCGPIDLLDGCGLVFEYVKGVHLDLDSANEVEKLAQVMVAIKSLNTDNLKLQGPKDYNFNDLLAKCSEMDEIGIVRGILEQSLRQIDDEDSGMTVVHGDLSQSNIIVDEEGEVHILDLDHLRVDRPLDELSRALIFFGFSGGKLNMEKCQLLTTAYSKCAACQLDVNRVLSRTLQLLIYMLLETYYYTYVVKAVDPIAISESVYNQTYPRLKDKLFSLSIDLGL